MNELRVCGPKESLADRAEAGLCGGTRLLRTLITGQERFEVGALEFGATINDDHLWQAPLPPDAVPQNHHAGPVARSVERQIQRKAAPRKGIGQNRHPRPPKPAARMRTDNFNVQLSVINVTDFEGAVSMARRGWLQLEIEGRVHIRRASALTL